VLDVKGIRKAKAAIKLAFRAQMAGLGFSMVEIVSACPVNWHMKPQDALDWAKGDMLDYFPLGDTKITEAVAELRKKK